MMGFYSVRKLLDTFKVSDDSKTLKYDVLWYKNIKPVTYYNWHHIDELYDLRKTHTESRDIRFICDKFIHSYVFVQIEDDAKLKEFYITTDTLKNKKCYFVSIDSIISIFRIIGRDYPANSKRSVNTETGEIEISAW